jgi:hypothetical protein
LKCILNVHQSVLDQVIALLIAASLIIHVVECMDKRQHCAALFIDLSNDFETVDHSLLIQRLTDRTATDGIKSAFQDITKGVPQGLILGPVF